jgi:carboxyl-terminal processing protease
MDMDRVIDAPNPEPRQDRRPAVIWRLSLALACGVGLGWAGAMGCASRRQPDFQLMTQAWNTIRQEYVNHNAVAPTDLTYGAISGMVDALGDTGHSAFLTPAMVKELRNMERGEFKGIGIEIQMRNGHVVVVAPLDDSPAQKAGLMPGDIILRVDGQDITDWPVARVVEKITGRSGTKVNLAIQDPRTSRTRDVTVVRASIKLHEVTWYRLPGSSVAHVRVATFDAGVTRDLRKALTEIQQQGLKGIVLDLRNNPGGLLDEAVSTASQFLAAGNVVLAKNAKGSLEPLPVEKGGLATNMPLVALVNQGSASAAEIVAGALQDAHRAPLVGETTFGTGTVLQEFRLSDGSALLLAVEEWLTPNGHSFWHKGITPRYLVPMSDEINPLLPATEKELTPDQLQSSDDKQLLTALKLVTELPPSDLKAYNGINGKVNRLKE